MPLMKFRLPGGFNVDVGDTPSDGQVLTFNSTISLWDAQTPAAVGEVNTSSNAGAGEGLALAKVGVDLPFKSLIGDTEIVLAGNANDITFSIAAALARIATAQTWTQLQTFNAGINLNATGKLGLDGLAIPESSIRESSANIVAIEAGGRDALLIHSAQLEIPATTVANEGGEILMKGEGANVDWNFDNFSGTLRFFESATTHLTLSPTELKLSDIILNLNSNNLNNAVLGTNLDAAGSSVDNVGAFITAATNPATSGAIRFGNAESLVWRNAANSANLTAIAVNSSDTLVFAIQTFFGGIVNFNNELLSNMKLGTLLDVNTQILQFVDANQTITNNGGNFLYDVATGQVHLWRVNNVTEMQLSATALAMQGNAILQVVFLTSNATNPADAGTIRLGNAQPMNWRNAGNTANFGITGDANDNIAFDTNLDISTKNILTDTTTGTKMGTSSTQKLGKWGVTPVIQPAHIADADGTLADITTKFNTLLAQHATTGEQAAS